LSIIAGGLPLSCGLGIFITAASATAGFVLLLFLDLWFFHGNRINIRYPRNITIARPTDTKVLRENGTRPLAATRSVTIKIAAPSKGRSSLSNYHR
jgi:hypothetical protein